jgi:hypothetical protein
MHGFGGDAPFATIEVEFDTLGGVQFNGTRGSDFECVFGTRLADVALDCAEHPPTASGSVSAARSVTTVGASGPRNVTVTS